MVLGQRRVASNTATFGRDLRAVKPGMKVIRHRPSSDVGSTVDVALGTPWTDDPEDELDDELSIVSTGDTHCSANICTACDGNLGKGCPTCKPEDYGLPSKRRP